MKWSVVCFSVGILLMYIGISILFNGLPVCRRNRKKPFGLNPAERLKARLSDAVQFLIGTVLIIAGFKIFITGVIWE
ncbi:MAG: hypothetical protein LIO44_01665, partial [Eubacterium sp.]|nr:hypothetical protein [Eubacterium sp.]